MTDVARRRRRRRDLRERALHVSAAGAVLLALAFLVLLVGSVAAGGIRGLAAAVHPIGWRFLTGADATAAGTAGIGAALVGTLLTITLTMAIATPVGVLAALWLEVVARPGRITAALALGIENLAAVPPILFGLFGLVALIGTAGLPRASPLAAALVLAMMTMPVIVIAARSAIRAVPPSIREAAMAVGASPLQTAFHHLLPLALPGILTGTILAGARATGETAPLILIGMRAFIPAAAHTLRDPATVLPVQIFLWSDIADRGFVEKASAAIVVLLLVIAGAQLAAAFVRRRLEGTR